MVCVRRHIRTRLPNCKRNLTLYSGIYYRRYAHQNLKRGVGMRTIQIESSRETGNWAYVVRENGERILATGDKALAERVYLHGAKEPGLRAGRLEQERLNGSLS